MAFLYIEQWNLQILRVLPSEKEMLNVLSVPPTAGQQVEKLEGIGRQLLITFQRKSAGDILPGASKFWGVLKQVRH